MIRSILALAATIIVAGCASMTGPLGNEVVNATMNPKLARVVIYVKPGKPPDRSPDWFIHLKDSKPPDWLAAFQPEFVVDGKSVATWQPGFVSCDLQPGRHIIAVTSHIPGNKSFSADLRAGTVTYFAVAIETYFTTHELTLMNVTDIQGRADVGDLHQISGDCTTS